MVVLARGPHERGWIGWGGGWNLRNKKVEEVLTAAVGSEASDPEAGTFPTGTKLNKAVDNSEILNTQWSNPK